MERTDDQVTIVATDVSDNLFLTLSNTGSYLIPAEEDFDFDIGIFDCIHIDKYKCIILF